MSDFTRSSVTIILWRVVPSLASHLFRCPMTFPSSSSSYLSASDSDTQSEGHDQTSSSGKYPLEQELPSTYIHTKLEQPPLEIFHTQQDSLPALPSAHYPKSTHTHPQQMYPPFSPAFPPFPYHHYYPSPPFRPTFHPYTHQQQQQPRYANTLNSCQTSSSLTNGSQLFLGKRSVNGSDGESYSSAEQSKRLRTERRNSLECVGVLEEVDPRIRIWKNRRGLTFYDCACNKRKPIQDYKKIIGHCKMHGDIVPILKAENGVPTMDALNFACSICGRAFERSMQLNGHMRMHRPKNAFKSDDEVVDDAVVVEQELDIPCARQDQSELIASQSLPETVGIRNHVQMESHPGNAENNKEES